MNIYKKILSYVLACVVGLLMVAPPIGYNIPVMVNSFSWLYAFIACGMFGFYLLFTNLPTALKILSVYLFSGCFISECPYVSFNAYMLCIGAMYVFLWFTEADYKPVLKMISACLFLQVAITITGLLGIDKLMNFDGTTPVFVGTVRQYMRFSSLLAIATPFVVLYNKKFIYLILVLAVISGSSSFALAVVVGIGVYLFIKYRTYRKVVLVITFLGLAVLCLRDWTSISVAFTCGRIPVWGDIIKTVCYDTVPCSAPVAKNFANCAIDWKAIFFGRGLDTFLPLFPIYKHDFNPFPQAHNDFLQIWWEMGLVGAGIMGVYIVNLVKRLKDPLLLGGLACMCVNMFFAFPTRMTQTMLLMVCFLAYCEKAARDV
jgi:hypothetical protein